MPENTSPRPDFLSKLGAHNAIHGVMATFSEMKKTARRIEKAYDARPPAQELISADEFLRIHYSDPTPDTAIAHIENPDECDHYPSVQRRLNRMLVSA